MKNLFLVSLIIIGISLSCQNQRGKDANNFFLTGKIIGQDTGKIILSYGFGIKYHEDTAKIRNGEFTFQGTVEEPTRGSIIDGSTSNSVTIYLEPGKLIATIHQNKSMSINLSGSNSQKELDNLNKILESTNNKDSVLRNFVTKNPNSYLTPYYLCSLKISPDSLKNIYNGLNVGIQKSRWGRMAQGHIKQHQNTTVGEFATDFKAIDLNGDSITLSQFKGKNTVMLEFWSSTCLYCRQSIPHLKSLYTKYHSKGLEIIAIACMDISKESWISAINQDGTGMWHQIGTVFRNGLTINEQPTFDYPYAPIPRTILIDVNGRILGNWEGKSDENTKSLDNELKRIFSNKS
ncbi:MAG: TlpA disulfide reductase family protein [Bacteroidota bacterium]|nr:TlpA disulfide reductase family protein [Bacteroidota bacterium]